jgi:uncharacterized protein YraI
MSLSVRRDLHASARAFSRLIAAVAILLSVCGGVLMTSNAALAASGTVDSALNLRTGPSTSHRVILVMPGGASLEIIRSNSSTGYYKVNYGGTIGWAYGGYISADDGSSGGSSSSGVDAGSGDAGSAVTTSSLNLRTGPSTGYAVILVMPSGASVTLTGASQNGFLGVTYGGSTGWASGDYLDASGGASAASASTGNSIVDIIYAAAATYGQSGDDMLRVAQCESGLDPNNYTPPYGAAGLFQFLPGTWASTPFAGYSVYDPWANANAAAWMWSVGRRGEWVCQ